MPQLPLPNTTFQAIPVTSVLSLKLSDSCDYIYLIYNRAAGPTRGNSKAFLLFLTIFYLFVSLVHCRGRTRGRAVVDEEDSMDGTEITESIGPQDTGEALRSAFLFIVYMSAMSVVM